MSLILFTLKLPGLEEWGEWWTGCRVVKANRFQMTSGSYSQICHCLAMWAWTTYALTVDFLFWTIWITTTPTWQSGCSLLNAVACITHFTQYLVNSQYAINAHWLYDQSHKPRPIVLKLLWPRSFSLGEIWWIFKYSFNLWSNYGSYNFACYLVKHII